MKKFRNALVASLALTFILAVHVAAEPSSPAFSATMLPEAHDGDTPKLIFSARLWRVDCPEIGQPYAEEARDFTVTWAWGKPVRVEQHGVSYGRPVVSLSTLTGGDLALALVRAGLAWVEPRYNRRDEYGAALLAAQAEAKAARRGLWAEDKPVAPWEWRKSRKAAAK